MMMTGRHRGRKALAISGAACFMVRRSVRMGIYPLFLEIKCTSIIMATHRSTPGPMPAINSFPMEILAMEP